MLRFKFITLERLIMTEDFKLVREYQGWEVECLSDIEIPQEWIDEKSNQTFFG